MFVRNSNSKWKCPIGYTSLGLRIRTCLDIKIFVSSTFIQKLYIKCLFCARCYFSIIELETESIDSTIGCVKQEDCRQNPVEHQHLRKGQGKSEF